MLRGRPADRPRLFALIPAVLAAALATAACGSSANTFTSPSGVSKCAINVAGVTSTIPASGGTGNVTVTTERECQWTAQPDVTWLNITAGSSGQGDGTVQFTATANPEPVTRTGGIMLNAQRAVVTQGAAECRFELSRSSAAFANVGGTGTVQLQTSSPRCSWTASSDAAWITVRSAASGSGDATITFDVAPTTGPPRTATLTIGGQRFSVTQSEGCAFTIVPAAFSTGSAGGSGQIAVAASPGCPWTASSNANWIAVTAGSTGEGPGFISFSILPTTGPSRTGSIVAAGHLFTVTQAQGCSYDVQPASHSFDAGGGSGSVSVTSAIGCAWTASSSTSWITMTSAASGNGSATVAFSVAASTGPARTGTLVVAGQTVTVTQGQGCSYSISPESQSVPQSGASGTVAVTTAAGCAWTASSAVPWIAITSGTSGTGSGSVGFTVSANSGAFRSGTLTIAGRTFTVAQGDPCSSSISPTERAVDAAGGSGTVDVTIGTGCAWTASSGASWITITSGVAGTGNGAVAYTVAANNGSARTGTLTIAGHTFTVNQGESCSASISPTERTVEAAGGSISVNVRSSNSCSWTATSNALWITVTSGATGSGNGSVQLAVAANTQAARTGTVTIAGQTFTVTQTAACTYTVAPLTIGAPGGGGVFPVTVDAPAGCSWTATTSVPWITIKSGASGSGSGSVQLDVQANPGVARTGTATIAGHVVTINQAEAPCLFVVDPTSFTFPKEGGTGSINVTTSPNCAWTAVSNASWIIITSGASGKGNGVVQFTLPPENSRREGTLTVAGQTVNVVQKGT